MEIKDAKYYKSEFTNKNVSINCTIDGEKWSIPMDEDNRYYVEILKQVKEGTLTIKDAE